MKEEEKKEVTETSLDTRCPACNSSISFNPKEQKWKCEYCGSSYTVEEMQQHQNSSTEKNNQKQETSKAEDPGLYISYKCQSCGAEILADEQTSATFCVYCGNTAILKSKLDGAFAPDCIIPFKKTKEDAIEAFKKLNKGKPLMPKFFNDVKNIENTKSSTSRINTPLGASLSRDSFALTPSTIAFSCSSVNRFGSFFSDGLTSSCSSGSSSCCSWCSSA